MSASSSCVQCGKCLSVCPLFAATNREELSPRGKSAMLGLLETRPDGLRALPPLPVERLAALCLGCGRCEKACPRGVCIPDRLKSLKSAHPAWRRLGWKAWIAGAETLWPQVAKLARLAPALEVLSPHARMLSGLAPARRPDPWLVVAPSPSVGLAFGRPAALFPGCLASGARTDWREKAERLLREGGVTLAKADFGCCGCSLGHAGLPEAQAEARERNIAAWRAAGRPLIIAFCATCECGLRAYPREHLGFTLDEAGDWRAAVQPLSKLLKSARLAVADPSGLPAHVLHHRPCHGGGGKPDAALLAAALATVGRSLVNPDIADGCCGFGGLTRLADPALADAVSARNWKRRLAQVPLAPSGEVQVLTGCSACAAHLAATAPEGVVAGHWLDAIC